MLLYGMECNIGVYKSTVSSLVSLSCSARLSIIFMALYIYYHITQHCMSGIYSSTFINQ